MKAESSRVAFSAAAGIEMATILIGVGVVVLGILVLTGLGSEVLIAVAFLSFGAYLFLKGTATVGHMFWWNRSDSMTCRSEP